MNVTFSFTSMSCAPTVIPTLVITAACIVYFILAATPGYEVPDVAPEFEPVEV